jgi:hypothetical protein
MAVPFHPVENIGETVLGEQEEYVQAVVDAAAEIGVSFALPKLAAVSDKSTIALTEQHLSDAEYKPGSG